MPENDKTPSAPAVEPKKAPADPKPTAKQQEIGGPEGPEPTRFGDWEKAGRCSDF